MNDIKRIVGIDVYRERYDACFLNIDTKVSKNYTGSCNSESAKQRLLARVEKDDLILISESKLAAILALRFLKNVIIINTNLIRIFVNANVERGKDMAVFFTKNLANKKNEKLSEKMVNNILIEGKKRFDECERLASLSEDFIDSESRGESIEFSEILAMEEEGRIYANDDVNTTNKIEEILKNLENFEKLNKNFS